MSIVTNKLLRVDLRSGVISVETLSDAFLRRTMGGKGLISHYLLKELPPGVEPLSPENKLVMAAGVLTGAPVSGMTRLIIGAKSPLTNGYGQSEGGGPWGPELRRCGYIAIIFENKADHPVYLSIEDDKVELRDAGHIWGKETGETEDILRAEYAKPIKVLQIGPAGENLVRYACIINNLRHANGRNGLGAVMGSKNLKAVVTCGSGSIPMADKAKVTAIGRNFIATHMSNPLSVALKNFGTGGGVTGMSAGGMLPTRNFHDGEFEFAAETGGQRMMEEMDSAIHGCPGCAVKCKRVVSIPGYVDPRYGGPEYETLVTFGSLCLINKLEIPVKAHEVCNRLGIDTISSGSTIAFAMEAYEAGLLSDGDCDNKPLLWGDGERAVELLSEIAYRNTKLGDLLAEGSQRIAEQLPPAAMEMLSTCKGQEIAMHDARGKVGVALGYALNEFGGDHMVMGHDPLLKAGAVFDTMAQIGLKEPLDVYDLGHNKVYSFGLLQHWWSFFNCAGVCFFAAAPRGAMPPDELLELARAMTGWDLTMEELLLAGERATVLGRVFNLREGIGLEADALPRRLHGPLKSGALKGRNIDEAAFIAAMKDYYQTFGLDDSGRPTAEKACSLQIEEYLTV